MKIKDWLLSKETDDFAHQALVSSWIVGLAVCGDELKGKTWLSFIASAFGVLFVGAFLLAVAHAICSATTDKSNGRHLLRELLAMAVIAIVYLQYAA